MEDLTAEWRGLRHGAPSTVDSVQENTYQASHATKPVEKPLHGAGGGVTHVTPVACRGRGHPGTKEVGKKGDKEVIDAVGGHDPLVGVNFAPVHSTEQQYCQLQSQQSHHSFTAQETRQVHTW